MAKSGSTKKSPKVKPSTVDKSRQHIRNRRKQERYLAYSVILEEGGSPRLLRLAMAAVTLVIMAFVGWASVTRVNEVAVSHGEVQPAGRIQPVQHLEGGVLANMLVEDGMMVEAGQVLAIMSGATADADLDRNKTRLASLELQAERLRAFADGRAPDFGETGKTFPALAADQQAILDQQIASRESQREILNRQVNQLRTDISTTSGEIELLKTDVRLLGEQVEMRRELFEKGLDSRLVYLNVQRQHNQSKTDQARLRGTLARNKESLGEVETRLVELDDRLRQEALSEMGQINGQIAEVRDVLGSLQTRVDRLEVRAPVRGLVQGLTVTTSGQIIGPGQELMNIVPVNDEMLIEARVSTRDIGHLRPGQEVTVKVTTFDFARYGGIDGQLESISASTFFDPGEQPYYKARISLAKNYVGDDPALRMVQPGMVVQADITTGEKTLLQYLIKPIYNTAQQAFSER